MPHTPNDLMNHIWSLDGYPYLPFCDKSPFQGELFALLATSANDIVLEHDCYGWHLTGNTAKQWKLLEQTLSLISLRLKKWFQASSPPVGFKVTVSELLSEFGYFTAHSTDTEARCRLRSSLDAFAVYFAFVSFLAALCQFTGKVRGTPAWLVCLDPPDDIPLNYRKILRELGYVESRGSRKDTSIHSEFLNMFKRSHIINFSGEQTSSGAIINVLRCDWTGVAEVLLKAM